MFKNLFKSIIIYGIASAVGKFIGLFLVPVYTRVFTPEQYGIIDLIQTVTAIVAIFGILLLESATQRYYYEVRDNEDRKKYLSTILWTICILSFLCVILVTLLSKKVSILLFNDEQYYNILILASIKIPISNLFIFTTVIIRYMKKPVVYILFILIQLITTVTLSIWLVVYRSIGIIGVFYGQLAGFLIALLLMLLYLRKNFIFYWNRNILKKLFSFSLPQVPARFGVIGNTYASRFVILGYLSLSDIGLYTIAVKIASFFLLLQSAFSNAWYPFFYDCLENKDHKNIYKKVSKYGTVFILVIVSLFALYSKELLMILTTDKYYAATPLIGLLAFSHGLIIINNTVNLGTLITKKTIYGTYTYLVSAIINILFLFILVPKIGLIGAPISLLIGNITLLIFAWFISEKLYYIGFNKVVFIMSFILTLIVVVGNILLDVNFLYKIVFSIFSFILIVIYFHNIIKTIKLEFLRKIKITK